VEDREPEQVPKEWNIQRQSEKNDCAPLISKGVVKSGSIREPAGFLLKVYLNSIRLGRDFS